MIRTTADELREQLAPLYHHYPRQTTPQPAYVELDFSGGEPILRADWNPEIGNAAPRRVYGRLALRWVVNPYLRGQTLAAILVSDRVQGLAARIAAGHAVTLGHGSLTLDAEAAVDEMAELLDDDDRWSPNDLVEVYDADDWVADMVIPPGADIDIRVAEAEDAALAAGVLITGDLRAALVHRQAEATEEAPR